MLTIKGNSPISISSARKVILVPKESKREPAMRFSKELVDAVLEMWASGIETKIITAKFGLKPHAVASCIVWEARKRGDPRAIVRNPRSIGVSRHRKW